ncbi:ABC transporter ATP-binding protein [Ottowia thiooxydans]|uniref:ABC transporter ATP-binding protein n=1 Tax=Ottowia thiooxydans TaxID=219182 RepID=UPI00048A65E5|nr:ABC transporter ATP-binding protein [Ottowia thiooxydans]
MLEVKDMRAAYGRIEVLDGVSLDIEAGEIVALIGANGAGKTTLLRTLSGVHPLAAGQIFFDGVDVSAQASHVRLRAGMAQVPEGRQVFGPLSVRDNLLMGAYVRDQAEVPQDIERMLDLFPILREKQHLPAGSLSGGQQQMLALGRALMARPRLLLLDEPSMGLAPVIVQEVFRIIRRLRGQGTTILLVEQNAHLALTVADRAYVMESGRIAFSGDSGSVRGDPQVQKAYLGL